LVSVLLFYLLSPGNSDSLSRRNCDLELEEDSEETFIDVSARAIPEENYVCGREDRRFNKGNENSQVHAAGKAGT